MSWEYHYLKRRLGFRATPLMRRFEVFCERAFDEMADMEWSCKLVRGRLLADRFIWSGRPGRGRPLAGHIQQLLRSVDFRPTGLPGGLPEWDAMLERQSVCTLVAYAGPDGVARRSASLKVYLTLSGDTVPELYGRVMRPCMPELPEEVPPGRPTLLLGYMGSRGDFKPRLYLLYGQEELSRPSVVRYLQPKIGERGLELLRGHNRAGLAFKRGATDMLLLGFRPTGSRDGTHLCHLLSPLLVPVSDLARKHPALAERLHRLTWVTIPLRAQSQRLLAMPDEMNLYLLMR